MWIPRQKELGFFDVRWDKGLPAYREDFAAAPDGCVAGEATPTYLAAPGALERIASTLPDVRLVAILRDPVDRFWSQYWYARRARAVEGRSVTEVLADDPAPYLEPGRYGHHLGRVLELFDRTQLHVVLLPELRSDPDATHRELAVHLGVEPVPLAGLGAARNQSYAVRFPWIRRQMLRHRLWARLPVELGFRIDEWNRVPIQTPEMPADVRRQVSERYAGDTEELQRLLGRRVPWAGGP